MGFIGLTLTRAGRRLIASAISEEDPLNITHIQLGEGICEGTFAEMKGLAKKVMEIPVKSVKRDEGKVIVNCDFNSTEAPKGFYFREVGIIGNGVLCYYDNSGDDAEYIDPETEGVIKQKRLRFTLTISSDVTVTVKISSELYALAAEVEENLDKKLDKTGDASETTVTFSQASKRENISAGEKLSVIFGKIGKWLSDLKTVAFTGKYEDLSGIPDPLTAEDIGAVKKAGDKMTGKLEAHGGISLNGSTTSANIQYILGVDVFAEGGTVHYQNAADVSVGKLGGLGSGLYFCAKTTGGNFTGDIDTVYNNGAYWCKNATHRPTNDPYGLLIVQAAGTTDVIKHTYIPHIGNGLMGAARERIRVNNVWSPWRVIETEGSDLVCGDYFYMTDDEGRKRNVLRAIGDGSGTNNYGSQLLIGSGGNTFIGSGESAGALYTALQTESNKKTNEMYSKGSENMFISSDGHLYLYSNANIVANRKGLCFSNAGILSPIGTDNISFGTLDNPFYEIFAKNLRLKPKGANYGSKLWFGDSEYVYLYEDTDDHLLIHASKGATIEIVEGYKLEFGMKQYFDKGETTKKWLYPCYMNPNGEFKWESTVGQPIQTTIDSANMKATYGNFYELSAATYINVGNVLQFSTSGGERIEYDNHMVKIYASSGIVFGSYIKSDICPTNGGTYTLGKSNDRWKEIWCSTSLNTSSDRNLKKDIQDLSSDERYAKFFMLLQPKSYLFKDGESGRTHVGFISQDVEGAMAECGLSSLEFAGFCKDQKIEVRQEMEEIHHPADKETGKEEWTEQKENQIEEPVFDDEGNPVYEYSLRYEEFIAFNTMMIQELYKKNETLEDRISKLEEKIL